MGVALLGFAAVLILAFMRMPLGIALGLVGVIGFGELSNYRAAFPVLLDWSLTQVNPTACRSCRCSS
jgi:hypothetical protein